MTFVEVTTIIVGGAAGYWVVAEILQRFSVGHREGSSTAQNGTAPDATGAARPLWCETLEVEPTASLEEVRRSYRSLMSQYHPDKVTLLGKDLRELAEAKSKTITSAYRDALRWHGAKD